MPGQAPNGLHNAQAMTEAIATATPAPVKPEIVERLPYLTKGVRVRVSYFAASELGTYSLAGAQMKMSAQRVEFDGVITHVWGYGASREQVTDASTNIVVLRDDNGEEPEVPIRHVVGSLPYDRDPKGLESYAGPDGWWVLGKSGDQTTALLCRFSGQPQMVPAYPAGHEADGWSTFPTQEAARKAAWKFYALTATTK